MRAGISALAAVTILGFSAPGSAQTLKVFFGNLHSHTSYSDGSGRPSEAYKRARDTARTDFLAISEHNHDRAELGAAADRKDGILIAKDHSLYKGPKTSALIPAATKATKAGAFVAIYGQEFSSIGSGNHVNVFEVGEVIPVANGDFKGLVDWLTANPDSAGEPPIIQLNHPDELDDETIEYGRDDFPSHSAWLAAMEPHARLVEIVNGPAMTKTSGAHKVMEQNFLRLLNLGLKLAPVADQDNHYRTWGNSSTARTAVIADELTKPKVMSALRARHVYATEDRNLRVLIRVNGGLIGDVLPAPAANSELSIEVSIQDDDEPSARYQVDVLSDSGPGGETARVIDSVTIQGNTSSPVAIEDVRFTGPSQYLLFRVKQTPDTGDVDRAWTAPVWFQPPPTPPPSPTVVAPAVQQAIASKRSRVYHVSPECVDAKRIKPANRLSGDAAMAGRVQHEGCPRRAD